MPQLPSAVIFDFNGTLFFDSDKHIAAWKRYFSLHGFPDLSEEVFRERFLGRNNAEILEKLYGHPLPPDETEREAEAKEALYRRICLEHPNELHLVAGVEHLFDELTARHIPFTLATGSNLSNVQFYFETFGLGRWFDLSRVVYDDGSIPGKPDPTIYRLALQVLGEQRDIDPTSVMVFEDSFSGMHAARAAGVGRIIALTTPESIPYVRAVGLADTVLTNLSDLSFMGL